MCHHGAMIFQCYIAARALCKTSDDLVVDDLMLAGPFTLKFRRRQFDDCHRHTVIETQPLVGHTLVLTWLLADIGDLLGVEGRLVCRGPIEQLADIQLIGGFDQALLGFTTKQLVFQPIQLLLKADYLLQ